MSDIEALQKNVDAYKAAKNVLDDMLSKAVSEVTANRQEQAESQSHQD